MRDSHIYDVTDSKVIELFESCNGDFEILKELLKLEFDWNHVQCIINTVHLYPNGI